MVIDALLARARGAGLVIKLDVEQVVIRGPETLAAIARALREREPEVRALLARGAPASASGIAREAPENAGSAGRTQATPDWCGLVDADVRQDEVGVEEGPPEAEAVALARAKAGLRARLDRADRIEAAARARGEPVPDPDDPSVDYWRWHDAQPDPPPADAGPWPRETVSIRMERDGRLVSGPLCDPELFQRRAGTWPALPPAPRPEYACLSWSELVERLRQETEALPPEPQEPGEDTGPWPTAEAPIRLAAEEGAP